MFDVMYRTIVSLLPRLLYPLRYDIRCEQICKTINISSCLVTLNSESELEWFTESIESKTG